MSNTRTSWILRAAAVTALHVGAATAMGAAEVKVLRTASQAEFLAGTLDAVSIDPLGTVRLAQRVEEIAKIAEPFVFSAQTHPEGWVVGTGNSGRVIKVDRSGNSTVLFETAEPEIFAVWADADGTVFAGSSPNGKIYRYAEGTASVFFDPGQTYIWQLARHSDGDLLAATGTEGKLFKIDSAGNGRLLYDADDTHIRALMELGDGSLLVGTAGEGLVLRIDVNGVGRTLFDAAAAEVVAFAAAAEDGAYFAVLGSEASFVDLSSRTNGNGNGSSAEASEENQSVEVDDSAQATVAGSRVRGFRGPRSQVYHWTPSGGVESVWRFDDETIFALSRQGRRLWVGTGLAGKLYSFQNEQMVVEKDIDESQIVALMGADSGPAFASTNSAALFRFVAGSERSGTLTSAVLDAEQTSRFGTLRWQGDLPTGSRVDFSVRVGLSSDPDRTWSQWTEARAGREISLGDVDSGRYLQWRAEISSNDNATPTLRAVEVSYLQMNQKPEISTLEVMDPGQILVPGSFNASNQVFEPAHPNRDGIFTSLEPTDSNQERNLKTLWKQGYRTLRWTAEDANEDELRYAISFRREDEPQGWLAIASDLKLDRYGFDSTVLPDGYYRFRVEAADRQDEADPDRLSTTKVSDMVVVDHTPATLTNVRAVDGKLSLAANDALSALREVVYSIDADDWQTATVDDGLLDGHSETFSIDVEPGATLVLLRITDAAFNVKTYDLSRYLP